MRALQLSGRLQIANLEFDFLFFTNIPGQQTLTNGYRRFLPAVLVSNLHPVPNFVMLHLLKNKLPNGALFNVQFDVTSLLNV